MRKKLTETAGCALRGWDTLFCFEILYQALGHGILFPFVLTQLDTLPGLLGVSHLGMENAGLLLRSPAALLLLAGLFLFVSFYLLFELTALFVYAEAGWRRQRIRLRTLCVQSFLRTAGLFRPRRAGVLLLAPPLLLSFLSLASGWLRAVRVPEFILDHIRSAPGLAAVYATVVLGCNALLLRYLFGLPAMTVNGFSFRASWRESGRLLRGRWLRTLGALALVAALFLAAFLAFSALAVLLLAGFARAFSPAAQARGQFQLYFALSYRAWVIAAGALTSIFLCAFVLVLYHDYRGETRPQAAAVRRGARGTLQRAAFLSFTLALLLIASESELGGRIFPSARVAPLVVAHRAGGGFAPENTLAALEQAITDGAQEAEIDVRRLADGTLAVLHDANFKRTTGVDLDVSHAVAADLRRLDAGSRLFPGRGPEPVPTLSAMLQTANDRIELMIELKPTDSAHDLEDAVLSLLRSAGMERRCSIASTDPDTLRRVKADAPQVRTVYVTALLLSDRYDLPYVDAYSIETTALTPAAVTAAHASGKLVYGWTANSSKTLQKLLYCGVDGIITDNVPLARYCIETDGDTPLLDELTALFFGAD